MAETRRSSEELRPQVTARARERCEYCLSPAHSATQRLSVEHSVPRAKGGATTLDNLALACQGCNNHTYNRIEVAEPVSVALVPLYNSRRDQWVDHFAWSDDALLIVGLTPTGRATITALLLSREGVVNLRQLLLLINEHPPAIEP